MFYKCLSPSWHAIEGAATSTCRLMGTQLMALRATRGTPKVFHRLALWKSCGPFVQILLRSCGQKKFGSWIGRKCADDPFAGRSFAIPFA